MRVTVDLILFALFGTAFLVACAVMVRQIVVEAMMVRRSAREDAARDASVAARLAEDTEVEWLYSIPTMKWDPEKLGGAS